MTGQPKRGLDSSDSRVNPSMPLIAKQVLCHGMWGFNANVGRSDVDPATSTDINDH
jgi:hypothetical protein